MLRDSREVFKVINPVVEERNRRAKLMNQIGEMKNKIMDVQREMESDPENIKEQVTQKTRLLDKTPTNELEKVLEDLEDMYKRLCEETKVFIPTDFSSKRFVKSKKDGKQPVYDEKHNKVGEATYKDGRMVGEYREHDLSNYDELRNYFDTSPYVVDLSVKYDEEAKCFEKKFYYSIRREEVESLSKPIDPLVIVEVGYDERERIKYIRRVVYDRYIDKATFDENGNLRRIHYNVKDENGHYQPHCIVFRNNGQFKYYIRYNKFLVEWGSTTRRDVNGSFSTIRSFGDYCLKPSDSGKLCAEIDSQEGAAVYFYEYYYALFREGQLGLKDIKIPSVKKEDDHKVEEKKAMPKLLDTTVSSMEDRVIGRVETVPGGLISSSFSYSDQPYYQEFRSDSKDVVASVSYLVPIVNADMPLMGLVYKDGKRRVLQKNGNVPPNMLNDAIDDGHNCNLERVKELFFDFSESGYEGLDPNIPVPDLHKRHLPEDIADNMDEISSEGEIDEVNDSTSEDSESSGNKPNPVNHLPEEIPGNKEPVSDGEGEIDEVSDSTSEGGEHPGDMPYSENHLPEDIAGNKDALSDEGEIDEVSDSTSDETNKHPDNKPNSGNHLPEEIADNKEPVSEGDIDEVVTDSISDGGNNKDERNQDPYPKSISVDSRRVNPSNEDSISQGSEEGQHTAKSDAISESGSSNDERNQDPMFKPISVDRRPDEPSPVNDHLPEEMERELHEVGDEEQNEVNRNLSDHREIYDSGAIDEINTSARPHLYV